MFKKKTYINRRSKLKKNIKTGIILLPGNDESPIETFENCYPFRQDSTFSYYTGINRTPSVTLIIDIDNDKEILFADNFSLEDQIWTGPLPQFTETAKKTGISDVRSTEELKQVIDKYTKEKRDIYYPPVCRGEVIIKLSTLLKIKVNEVNKNASKNLVKIIIKQRELKTSEEIKEIESALDISYEIYSELLKLVKPGYTEKELLGVLNSIFTANGSMSSFPSIVTVKGEILHNIFTGNTLKDGDLLLVDSGAVSTEGYSSDITRTYPVSGKFTKKQRNIYNIVLTAQMESIAASKPGVLYRDVHLNCCKTITRGLIDIGLMRGNTDSAVEAGAHAIFMPCGLGHMMGIDDHDMELYGEDNVGYNDNIKRSDQFGLSALRFARELKANHVVTAEPGIYFIPGLIDQWKKENKLAEFINYSKLEEYFDFGGIRIEDDILITETGSRVLGKPIPKEIPDIEELMSNR